MNHLKWMGHSSTIMDIQRSLRNDNHNCEVILASRDGVRVRAHLFVLSTCSELMRNILVDVPRGQEATIVLPDIRGELLESMLSFIYMGETSLPSASLSEFLEAINLLGIKSAISFECNPSASPPSADVENGSMAVETAKSITGLQIAEAELLEEEEEAQPTVTVPATVLAESQHQPNHGSRSLEYLDVYEPPKITYSIEHMDGNSSGNQFILTENTGTFTITQAATSLSKMDNDETATSGAEVELVDDDAEAEITEDSEEHDTQMIDEEFAQSDPLIELGTATEMDDDEEVAGDLVDDELEEEKPRKLGGGKPRVRRPVNIKTEKRSPQKPTRLQQFVALKREVKDDINDALDLAADAVILEGLSLQKAADRFDISKTVLWRRVRTNPAYMRNNRERPSLIEAYERLKNGDSLKSISTELQIPMSTLHRHKVRLSAQGRLPDFVACRRRDSTPKDELRDKLAKAVHACLNEGMSQNHAANLFEIPKSTLWRHLQRRMSNQDRKVKKELQDEYDEDMLN
ncbi:modifier of mdg4 [Drosophila subpulchrella]|uniref:modifier of mdg4 n=1 Tax=Drosophila subpulchrella TaxID=1486046 RepID=UPI0018A129DA|nr:modifier of mdg4 [Drosophila subpulchrella]